MAAPIDDHMQKVDLTSLTLPQLNQLRNEFDQDLSVYNESIEILNGTKAKFAESESVLKNLKADTASNDVLIPLTASLYVPGKIIDPSRVTIDVGTGYYVKQDIRDAQDYFKRKVAFVTEQVEKINVIAIEKVKVRSVVSEVLDMKLKELTLRGKAQ